jgi:hypothetical protein
MHRSVSISSAVGFLVALGMISTVSAQQAAPAQGRQGGGGTGAARAAAAALILDMKLVRPPSQTGQTKVVQENMGDPNLELKQYGLHANCNLTSGNPASETTPFSLWSGECEQPFATMFRHKAHSMDLTGQAKVRWTVKTSGFHVVRPVVKLADETMYVGDFASQAVPMLMTSEFVPAAIRWIKLDPKRLVTVRSEGGQFNYIWASPDLTKVEEAGFIDLMPASGHGTGGYIHVSEFKVYGKALPRAANTASR